MKPEQPGRRPWFPCRPLGVLLVLVLMALALSSCAMASRAMLGGLGGGDVSPYQSRVAFGARGDVDITYQILGEGHGRSCGWSLLMGLFARDPSTGEAAKAAVDELKGDILLEARQDTTVTSVLGPLLFVSGCVEVRGLVAKITHTEPMKNKRPASDTFVPPEPCCPDAICGCAR